MIGVNPLKSEKQPSKLKETYWPLGLINKFQMNFLAL
jgi:hypothetical protein